MLRNLDIFILETLSHMTRRVALANGGEAMPYSDLSVGRIEGLQRTIPALVADGITDGDNWYVVNLIDNTNNMSRYVQSVAVLGATSQEQAREWALKNIGAFIGANDAWNTAYTSTKVLKTFLNRPSTSVAMIAIRQNDLDTIARQITDKPVVWDGSRLVSHDATSLLHELVKHDDEVMMMDAMTPADLPILMVEMGGEVAEYDALIVDYNRLDLLMQRLNAAMQKSSVGNVKPVNVTQSKPFKRNSVTNVAALFEMSDGQSVTIVFHSPDNTPAKLSPSDTLTSWKWMLNKRDISAAVSPKNGENVQMPDLAKRILTIVEKNSARFIRANGNKAAQIQELTDTNTRIGQKQEALAGILAVNKDLQKQIDEAGKQVSDANAPEIERIASLYAAALGQPVSKRSREFASDILSKNAYGLEFIANGMNDKGKKVFSEVTGVSLPKQQGATWKAIRDWAGISDEQEAYRVALRDVGYAVKSLMRDNSVSQEMAEKNKALIASKIAEGFDSVQKIGKDYWLTNKEGQGINLSERPKKGYLGLSKSRALIEAMITESKAKKMLDSSVVQSPELPQQEPLDGKQMPERIKDELRASINALQSIAKSFDQIIKVKGSGNDLAMALQEKQPDIDSNLNKIADIKRMAEEKGINFDEVMTKLSEWGGVPDFKKYGRTAAEQEIVQTTTTNGKPIFVMKGDLAASVKDVPIYSAVGIFTGKSLNGYEVNGHALHAISMEVQDLAQLASAEIIDIGSENIYILKDGLHYYAKVGNTENYSLGEWDFAQYPEGKPATVAPVTQPEQAPVVSALNDLKKLSKNTGFDLWSQKHGVDEGVAKSILDSNINSALLFGLITHDLPPNDELLKFQNDDILTHYRAKAEDVKALSDEAFGLLLNQDDHGEKTNYLAYSILRNSNKKAELDYVSSLGAMNNRFRLDAQKYGGKLYKMAQPYLSSQPVEAQPEPASEPSMTNPDRDYLQSIIDGKADLSNGDDVEAKLTDISERLDAELEPIFEQAAEAFAQYAIAQAATV